MISKIQIMQAEELTQKAKKLDWMLTHFDPEWKSRVLYEWCWGNEQGGEGIDPREIYDLKSFDQGVNGFDEGIRLNIYAKKPNFLLEEDNTYRKQVLTNIEPQTEGLFLYSPKREIREVDINDLFKI